jgi:cytochrome c5
VGQVVVTAPARDETAEPTDQQPAAEPAAEEDEEVTDTEPAPEEDAVVEEETSEPTETVAEQEQPAETEDATVAVNGVQIPAGVDAAAGQSVYASACSVCHAQGIAGAPVFGDAAAWNDRFAKGWDTLAHNSLNGIGAMPPKGGRLDLSDEEILSGVAYMIQQVR